MQGNEDTMDGENGKSETRKETYVSPELKKFPPIRVATGFTYYYYYYSYSYSS